MKFDPAMDDNNKKESWTVSRLKEGECSFKILNAHSTISKTGNEMDKIDFEISQGDIVDTRSIYLVNGHQFSLYRAKCLCYAIGHKEKYINFFRPEGHVPVEFWGRPQHGKGFLQMGKSSVSKDGREFPAKLELNFYDPDYYDKDSPNVIDEKLNDDIPF